MKYRNGFITNSSSSSFILAYKDLSTIIAETEYKDLLSKINTILEDRFLMIDSDKDWLDTTEGIIIKTKKELNEYINNNWNYYYDTMKEYFENYPEKKKTYNKYCKYIKNGYKILIKRIDNCDEENIDFFYKLVDDKNFVLLDEVEY